MVKPKTKQNIRAQRKFAQCAYIPPTQSASLSTAISKTGRLTSSLPMPGPVVQNNSNPRDFLSRLSLGRAHSHPEDTLNYNFPQPIVHLTRLPTNTESNSKKNKIKVKHSKSKNTLSRCTRKVSISDSGDEMPLINFTTADRSRVQTMENDLVMNKSPTSENDSVTTKSPTSDTEEDLDLVYDNDTDSDKEEQTEAVININGRRSPLVVVGTWSAAVDHWMDEMNSWDAANNTNDLEEAHDHHTNPRSQYAKSESSASDSTDWCIQNFVPPDVLPKLSSDSTSICSLPQDKPIEQQPPSNITDDIISDNSFTAESLTHHDDIATDRDNQISRRYPVRTTKSSKDITTKAAEEKRIVNHTLKRRGERVNKVGRPRRKRASDAPSSSAEVDHQMQQLAALEQLDQSEEATDETVFKRPNVPERFVRQTQPTVTKSASQNRKTRTKCKRPKTSARLMETDTSPTNTTYSGISSDATAATSPTNTTYSGISSHANAATSPTNTTYSGISSNATTATSPTNTTYSGISSDATAATSPTSTTYSGISSEATAAILTAATSSTNATYSSISPVSNAATSSTNATYSSIAPEAAAATSSTDATYSSIESSDATVYISAAATSSTDENASISTAATAASRQRSYLYNPSRPTNSRGRYAIPFGGDSDDSLEYDTEDSSGDEYYPALKPRDADPLPEEPTAGRVIAAPVYRPTQNEFQDPIAYIKAIEPKAAKYGMCKIIPPEGFNIPCHIDEAALFRTTNQYVGRLYKRWGPASKELAIIQIHMAMSEKFPNTKVPMFEGVELDLVKLYRAVERHGGLQELMENKEKWATIAEEMSLVSLRGRADDKLQKIYMRHVLPYVSSTNFDRERIRNAVDQVWGERWQRILARAKRPLDDVRGSLGEIVPTDSEENLSRDPDTCAIRCLAKPMFDRIEECTGKGRTMNLQTFRKVARQLHSLHFPNNPNASVETVEKAYWDILRGGQEHVCVQTAAIDTSVNNLGHESDPQAPGGDHPWNLKRISDNRYNVLRSLGKSLSVTVPTLCLNQVFSTNCWHMDPHKLAWTDFMHEGATKIWYSVAQRDANLFRGACETTVPAAVQNKSLWLPSDTAMVPLHLIIGACPLQRLVQNPGEYIVVFPGAYASSVATGMTISESIYFEDKLWLYQIDKIFQEMRQDCEPAMFSRAELLMRMASDPNVSPSLLSRVYSSLKQVIDEEIADRAKARQKNFNIVYVKDGNLNNLTTWPYQEECTTCRVPLALSKTYRVDDQRLFVCLPHGLHLFDLIRTTNPEVTPPELTLFYSDTQLHDILNRLEQRGRRTKRHTIGLQ